MIDPDTAVVVYAQRPWSSVFHRPQQIAIRLARTRRVIFMEPPCPPEDASWGWHVQTARPGLFVVGPHTGRDAPGSCATPTLGPCELARELLVREGIERHVAWLYTPLALERARALEPSLLVYDCMADMSAEPGALQTRERELLACADVVFAGGPALYRAKLREHSHVVWAPNSVDAVHFARARQLADHCDQAHLEHPRLGFFGVLDQRLDTALLERLARARPDWQIVMVGPVAGIDTARLPRHPNLHYTGARAYDELPHFLAGWDVCIVPFARNAATRCSSPAKLLEYMAAERPVVSTPLADVVEDYGDVAYVADGAERFIGACERALLADPVERARRAVRMRRVLTRTSWDATVNAMQGELANAAQRRAWRSAPRPLVRRTRPLDPSAAPRVS